MKGDINKVYNMDNVAGMKLLDDNCIDLTVTSPLSRMTSGEGNYFLQVRNFINVTETK